MRQPAELAASLQRDFLLRLQGSNSARSPLRQLPRQVKRMHPPSAGEPSRTPRQPSGIIRTRQFYRCRIRKTGADPHPSTLLAYVYRRLIAVRSAPAEKLAGRSDSRCVTLDRGDPRSVAFYIEQWPTIADVRSSFGCFRSGAGSEIRRDMAGIMVRVRGLNLRLLPSEKRGAGPDY